MRSSAIVAAMRLTDRFVALALALCLLAFYCAVPLRFLGNDTRPAVYTAVSLARRGDFDLDEYAHRIRARDGSWPYFVTPTAHGTVVSRYGPAVPVLAMPAFALVLAVRGGHLTEHLAGHVGRAVAAGFVASAAALLVLCARRIGASRAEALAVAAMYGLGTVACSVASQALWQHGPAQFFVALGLWALLKGGRGGHALGGFAFAMMALCRPPDAMLALAAGVYVVARGWRTERAMVLSFALAAAAPVALLLAFNTLQFGAPWVFTQISRVRGIDAASFPTESYWRENPLVGLAGLLLSPSRGLLVFSPMFALLALRWRAVREGAPPLVLALLGGFALMTLVLSRYYAWYGGWTYGYRMIGDAAPVLCLALLPVLRGADARGRGALWALAGLAVIIHVAGAWNYSPIDWDGAPNVDLHRARLWSLRDAQIVYVFTHRASPDTW